MDAAEWDDRYRSADRLWSAEPNLFVADRLRHASPARGLDLAAGEGRNAIWLASLGWEMTAVDFSEVAIERGRAHSDQVSFVVADVLEWAPDEQFDLILIAYLQLVEPELQKVVTRSREWLAPGGEMFLIGHDASNIAEGWGGPQYPEVLCDVASLVDMLDGLGIVEAQIVRRPVQTEEGTKFARDALVRARLA